MARSWIDGLIHSFNRRRSVRRYLRLLPRRLREDYGHIGPFTPEQVAATIRRHRISGPRYISYAQALFCDPKTLAEIRPTVDFGLSFQDLRREIAGQVQASGVDEDFGYSDVLGHAAHFGSDSAGGEGGHHGATGASGGGHH